MASNGGMWMIVVVRKMKRTKTEKSKKTQKLKQEQSCLVSWELRLVCGSSIRLESYS